MKITLTKEAVFLLNLMLRQPQQLPLARAGMMQANQMPSEFKSPDVKHAKKVATLRKWLEEKVMEPEREENKKEALAFRYRAYDGSLMQSYCEVVMDIVKFYQPIGMLTDFTTTWTEIYDVFEGRVHKLDSLDAITRPDEDEEESDSKITKIDEGKKDKAKEA